MIWLFLIYTILLFYVLCVGNFVGKFFLRLINDYDTNARMYMNIVLTLIFISGW